MTGMPSVPGYRRHGLYYPYFHVRNDRWLKVAALYWPKMVRIVPDGYQTRDSDAVRALSGDFIVRQPPGHSVEAIAPRFADVVTYYADELRVRFHVARPPGRIMLGSSGWVGPGQESEFVAAEDVPPWPRESDWDYSLQWWLTGVHVSEITAEVRAALVDAQLALPGHLSYQMPPTPNSVDGSTINDLHMWRRPSSREMDDWLLMHPQLVAVYSSVLAEDFATANRLQPTTDQDNAYVVTNNWTTDRIAAALLGNPVQSRSLTPDAMPEALGLLALDLVVPANLDRIPIDRIIDIRERYSAEFFAFGQAVDQAAASLAQLSCIRDQAMLNDYLEQVVTVQFAQPVEDLRKKIKRFTGDAMTVSINVKTQLPTGIALAGGAWLAGQPILAGTSAVAIALMVIGHGIRQQRADALQSAPAASFLLHTGARLQPRSLLNRTVQQLARIGGTSKD